MSNEEKINALKSEITKKAKGEVYDTIYNELLQTDIYEYEDELDDSSHGEYTEIKRKILNKIYEKVKDDICEEVKNELLEENKEQLIKEIRDEIYLEKKEAIEKNVLQNLYDRIAEEAYQDQVDIAKTKANGEYLKEKERYEKLLEKIVADYENEINLTPISNLIVNRLLSHEWENIVSPIEMLLVDRLRFDSEYMKDVEISVREDLEKETILNILKEKRMLQKLRQEIEEEVLETLRKAF